MAARESRVPWSAEPFGARTLFASDVVTIGVTRCGPEHPQFRDPGPVSEHCLLFPESRVLVERPGRRPFASSPNQVVFHRRGQAVQRRALEAAGDEHLWFAWLEREDELEWGRHELPPDLRAADFDDRTWDPRWTLVRRLLVRHLSSGAVPDRLWVEETAASLVRAGLKHLADSSSARPRRPVSMRERDVSERAQQVLRARFREAVTLSELAHDVGCSHFHLARVFRRVTGSTLHSYRARLRALAALEALLDGPTTLSELALRLGFASPSHFTQAFRRTFGRTPSDLARSWMDDERELVRELVGELGCLDRS